LYGPAFGQKSSCMPGAPGLDFETWEGGRDHAGTFTPNEIEQHPSPKRMAGQ